MCVCVFVCVCVFRNYFGSRASSRLRIALAFLRGHGAPITQRRPSVTVPGTCPNSPRWDNPRPACPCCAPRPAARWAWFLARRVPLRIVPRPICAMAFNNPSGHPLLPPGLLPLTALRRPPRLPRWWPAGGIPFGLHELQAIACSLYSRSPSASLLAQAASAHSLLAGGGSDGPTPGPPLVAGRGPRRQAHPGSLPGPTISSDHTRS